MQRNTSPDNGQDLLERRAIRALALSAGHLELHTYKIIGDIGVTGHLAHEELDADIPHASRISRAHSGFIIQTPRLT